MSTTPTSSKPSEAAMKLAHDIICHFDAVDIRDAARLIDAHVAARTQHFRAALAQARQVAANSSASAEGVVKMLEEALEEQASHTQRNLRLTCPLCGADGALRGNEEYGYLVACVNDDECGIETKTCSTKEDAEAIWARHTPDPASQQNAEPSSERQPHGTVPGNNPDGGSVSPAPSHCDYCGTKLRDGKCPMQDFHDAPGQPNGSEPAAPAASPDIAMVAAEAVSGMFEGDSERQRKRIRDIIHEKAVKPLEAEIWRLINVDLRDDRIEIGKLRAQLAALRAQPPAPDFDAAVGLTASKLSEHVSPNHSFESLFAIVIDSQMRPQIAAAEKRAVEKCIELYRTPLPDYLTYPQALCKRFGIEEQP